MPMIATTASMSIRGYGGLSYQFTGNPGINAAWLARIGTFGTSVGNKNIASRVVVYPTTGDFYIGGQENVGTTGIFGFAMTKFSSTGSILWQKIVGAFNTEAHVLDCCVDSSGNVYWIGTAQATSGQPSGYTTSSSRDAFFGKFNSDGTTGFIKRINLTFSTQSFTDSGECIAYSASDNTIVIAGRTPRMVTASSTQADQCFVAKFTTTGTQSWRNTYYNTASQNTFYARGVCVDSSGNIYLTVFDNTTIAGITFLALNSSGGIRFGNKVRMTGSTAIVGYRTTMAGSNIAMAIQGNPPAPTSATNLAIVTLYNSSGGIVWQKVIDTTRSTATAPSNSNTSLVNSNYVNLQGLTSDSSGNVYLAVPGRSATTADCILLYKFAASDGSVLWIRAIYINTGTVASVPTGLACLGDFLYLIGTTDQETTTTTSGQGNYIFAKLPIDGSAISATGYTVSTGISYINQDVGGLHSLLTPSNLVNDTGLSISNSNATAIYDGLADVALTVSNNSMTIESKTISIA
jgi:hypothetical protein